MLEKKSAFAIALTIFCGLNLSANAQSGPAGSITLTASSSPTHGTVMSSTSGGAVNLGNTGGAVNLGSLTGAAGAVNLGSLTGAAGAVNTHSLTGSFNVTTTLPSGFGGSVVTAPSGPPINLGTAGSNLIIAPTISGPGITAPVVRSPVSVAPIVAPTDVPSSPRTQSASPTFSSPNFDKTGFGTIAPSDLIRYSVRFNANKKNKIPAMPMVSLSALLRNPRPTLDVDQP